MSIPSITAKTACIMPALAFMIVLFWTSCCPFWTAFQFSGCSGNKKFLTPVLLLTAKSDVADKINGLDSGADDYLTKPFVTGELLARIRALTRRTGEVAVDGLQFHNLRLDSQNYTLSYGQEQIKLSLKEYQIMEIFMSNPKQIVSKEFFIEKIWGYESDVEYNNIEVYISFLRKKLQSIHANISIKTARGIGYFLEEQPA